ncbi:MAG TPA: hypothetical protein VLH79_06370 [Chthonomonadales bacterium]|nr:hypothetical protein [Chthonomonadales bacterium]
MAYFGQPNCYRLSNGVVEAIVTTDVGPRVIRYGLVGGRNLFAEMPDDVVNTELGNWRPMGGHRLWHAPEAKPRTYAPDNDPVKLEAVGSDGVRLTQTVEPATGIEKEMLVRMDADGSGVTVTHTLTNRGLWPVDLAPWALTIVAGGGVTILPQEPFRSHDEYLLPARPMVLWHYTDMTDPRLTLGRRYIRLRTDEKLDTPQKIGIRNKQGWAAYHLDSLLFIKRYPFLEGQTYPDEGCNTETFTKGDFMEVETLGPMRRVTPGESAHHVEKWYLFANVDIGTTEATLDAAIAPILARATPAL